MVKKNKKTPRPDQERDENHMQLFERLARVKNMHGAPGAPKPKGGGK